MFDKETKGVQETQTEGVTGDNFQEVLDNAVSKISEEKDSEIARLKQENLKMSKSIAESYMNRSFASKPSNPAEGLPSLEEAEKAWKSIPSYATNLDKTTAFLNYRHIAMANGHDDPLLIITKNDGAVSEEQLKETTAKCAEVLAQCVEDAKGDPATFRALMTQRTASAGMIIPTVQNKSNKRR